MTRRILLVEDDTNTRVALRSLLEAEGLNVDACEDAAQALQCLRERDYDSLLTDLVLPSIDGLQLTRVARELQPTLRCFVVSGCARPPEPQAGLAGWLSKPIDIEDLLAMLD